MNKATKKQIAYILVLEEKLGLFASQAEEEIKSLFGCSKLEELTVKQASNYIDKLKARRPRNKRILYLYGNLEDDPMDYGFEDSDYPEYEETSWLGW
jgi:hypothetical protein